MSSLVWLGLRCYRKELAGHKAGEADGAPNKNSQTKEFGFQAEGHGSHCQRIVWKVWLVQGLGRWFLLRATISWKKERKALISKFLISWCQLASSNSPETLYSTNHRGGTLFSLKHIGFAFCSCDASANMTLCGLTFDTDLVSKITLHLRNSLFCNIRKLVDGLHSLVLSCTNVQNPKRQLAFRRA